MRLSLCVLLVFASTASLGASCGNDHLVALCEQQLEEMRCPGALVGVFPDEGRPWAAAIGVAEVESNAPMRRGMRMRIGSVSKLFVGAMVLRLVDKGVLSLDDKVGDYVEGVPAGDRITLRMLGNQTNGLFDPIGSAAFQAEILKSPQRMWRPTEVLQFAFREPAYHEPGDKFRYTNTGTVLLGEVIRAATGRDGAAVLKEELLDPLDLDSTGFCTSPSPPRPTPSAYRFGRTGRWLGYGDVFTDVTGYSGSWSSWAGDMYSTIDDLGRCAKPLATGGLLSQASRGEQHAWQEASSTPQYGFLASRNAIGIGHDGDVPGFNAAVRYSVERKAAIVALTNLSNAADGSMPAEELAALIYRETLTPREKGSPTTR